MFTIKRLDAAYEKALRIPINHDSKFILFSDVHRGDNSLSDEFAHNQNIYYFALQYYYNHDYTYIEVGDGDELWEHSKFEVIRYAHSDVFMLLRKYYDENRFIMLYGNHNIAFSKEHAIENTLFSFYDEYEEFYSELFPNIKVYESVILQDTDANKEILIAHGHQGDFINDQIWPVMKLLSRHFWRYLHIVGFRNPASPAKNAHKRHKLERNFVKWISMRETPLIVGHTHRPKYPKKTDIPYFNTGCCIHPRNITGIEVSNGEISLVEWKIAPDQSGHLKIKRRIARGPRPLTDFYYTGGKIE